MKYIEKDFAKRLFSVPTVSGLEIRMIEFIVNWAIENNIDWYQDDYFNLYLTKGEKKEGEYYPCMCAHLDTVFDDQLPLADMDGKLKILERTSGKGTELSAENTGIGADDKAGILISLEILKRTPYIKACFFREEELFCWGSRNMDLEWFSDVGYVLGWDSPGKNRAAYACDGVGLFDMDFYNLIKDTCAEHGLTDFRSEPLTDVAEIRKCHNLICMNMGNGGYNQHRKNEFVVLEETDGAVGLGLALINLLGNKLYFLPFNPHLKDKISDFLGK